MSTIKNTGQDNLMAKTAQTARKPRKQYAAPPPACTEREFLSTVANHQMEIVRDDGVNRHLKFSTPGTSNRWFELLTWPGKLCISGDMGTFVFTRLKDMFGFFRSEDERINKSESLRINPGYWAEKCIASDRDGVERFNSDTFKARISEWLDGREASNELRDEVEAEVISWANNGEFRALDAALTFRFKGALVFENFYEVCCKEYTYSYLWCCYAIARGIQQYDAQMKGS